MNSISQEIINYIKKINVGNLNNWYAGITNNVAERKKQHEREKDITCEYLKYWQCKTEDEARQIEQELKDKGIPIYKKNLKIIAKGTKPSTIVYVFLAVSKKSQHYIRLLKK